MTNCLTECVETNGCCCNGCGTCSYCQGLELADVPIKTRVAANTVLLGSDSYGYPVSAISNYLNFEIRDTSSAQFSTSTGTSTLGTKDLYACTDTSAPRDLTISGEQIAVGSTGAPYFFTVKDQSGGAGTNRIRVQPQTGLIDGAASIDIIADYGALRCYSDGTNIYTV